MVDLTPIESIDKYKEFNDDVEKMDLRTLYSNQENGVNFNDEIMLKNATLKQGSIEKFKLMLEFEKIGKTNDDYMLEFRGYPLELENINNVQQLASNYTFSKPITEVKIGEKFTAEWEFDTKNIPHLIYFGFSYIDESTGESIRPLPVYFRYGYIK